MPVQCLSRAGPNQPALALEWAKLLFPQGRFPRATQIETGEAGNLPLLDVPIKFAQFLPARSPLASFPWRARCPSME